jgi:hypothetical protein
MSGNTRLKAILAVSTLVFASARLPADETVLFDDFAGPTLNNALWGLATWTIGDRTQFGNQPTFADDGTQTYIRLPLDTYNPGAPGQRVLGTEIYSLQNFELSADGIEYLARARLNETQGGLVAAFFTYNQRRNKGRWLSDEIDFEVLSNIENEVLVTSWDDWGAPGSDYEDGVHHKGAFLSPAGFDWTGWNTFAMRWYPDRVEWWVNEFKVYEQAAPVPDLAQPARASLWAGGTTWPDAFNATLAPVTQSSANRRFHWDVDYVMVTRLGDTGGPGPLQPPENLAANVDGSTVHLTWSDTANTGATYNVYRAWKPKGKATPDFNPVASVSAETFSYSEQVQDGSHLYRVTATDSVDESAPSNEVAVTVGSGGNGKPGR